MQQDSPGSEASSRSRALLTDNERQLLKNYPDVDMNHHSSVVARVRERLPELEEDLSILQDHHALAEDLPDEIQ